ncbi:hypothetical protein K466DRAFT_457325, partial [Polyporus arcularius HHB13444]
ISDEARTLLQESWRLRRYLIIDEYSMLSKSFLAVLLRNIAVGLEGREDNGLTSLNIILCGDLHQFPPVAVSPTEALFKPINLEHDPPDRMLGRKLYEEFNTVVILKEQMRVTDPVWRDFLDHLRYGTVQKHHINMLRTLVLGPSEAADTTLVQGADTAERDGRRWADAALVTPRHAVRQKWNSAALRQWCARKGCRLFICPAEDRVQGRPLTLRERRALLERSATERRRRRKDLPEEVEMAVGMKVMVTSNIETDLDVANGARGEIVDIILHPDEPPIGPDPVVTLHHPPAYILVKLHRTRA